MKAVRFLTDFGIKKKGDVCKYDSMLSSQLVHIEKVAEYHTEVKEEKKTQKKNLKNSK